MTGNCGKAVVPVGHSTLLSADVHTALERWDRWMETLSNVSPRDKADLIASRQYWDENFAKTLSTRFSNEYPVAIEPRSIGGIPVEVITPAEGLSPEEA